MADDAPLGHFRNPVPIAEAPPEPDGVRLACGHEIHVGDAPRYKDMPNTRAKICGACRPQSRQKVIAYVRGPDVVEWIVKTPPKTPRVITVPSCTQERTWVQNTPTLPCAQPTHSSYKRNTKPVVCAMCGVERAVGEAVRLWCKAHKHVLYRCCVDSSFD